MEMKTEYRRDLQHTWMILSGGDVPEEDAYEVRMLTENRISGLLYCKTVSMDGQQRFYYDVTSRRSAAAVLETAQIGKPMLEQILISLAKVMEDLSDYLLDPDGLLLSPEYIYCDPKQTAMRFCWYPGRDIRFNEQAKILGSALLPRLDQTDRAGVVIGYQFYQYCAAEELSLEVLRGLLRQKLPETEPRPAVREESGQPVLPDPYFEDPEETYSSETFGQRIKNWFFRIRKKKEDPETEFEPEADPYVPEAEFESDRDLYMQDVNGYGENEYHQKQEEEQESETMLLTPDMLVSRQEKSWNLLVTEPPGREREIPLTQSMYLVGKRGSGATLQLASSAVSRLHAKLEKTGESWYLCDLNSKNGTMIRHPDSPQERLLQPEETVELQEGDVIRFADVACRVKRSGE